MASRSIDMQCWKCGKELKHLLLPFSRYEECNYCKADLHACVACKHYDPNVSDGCREDRADFILDKDKANFCDYFKVNTKAYKKQDNAEAKAARAKLAELFGEELPEEDAEEEASTPQSEADRALAELKRLFGDD
ncbi:MAG: hypothetical protein MI746_16370 [Pseudomonadales bacterium]|nr:hypothetical protein [Pseudomonadales bacterium]